VAYQDIYLYGGASTNTFIGGTVWHPAGNNHSGTLAFNNAITAVTNQDQNEFGCYSDYQIVGLNDMSLPFGGVFDVGSASQGIPPGSWVEPHKTHDRGRSADFKFKPGEANSILGDPGVVDEFLRICRVNGLSFAQVESAGTSNQHVHCGFNGNGF
jgi:hypothetical protein